MSSGDTETPRRAPGSKVFEMPVRAGRRLRRQLGVLTIGQDRIVLQVGDQVVVDAEPDCVAFAVAPPSLYLSSLASATWRVTPARDVGAVAQAAAAAVASPALGAATANASTSRSLSLAADLLESFGADRDDSSRPRLAMVLMYLIVGPIVAVTVLLTAVISAFMFAFGVAWVMQRPEIGLKALGAASALTAVAAGPWGVKVLMWGVGVDFGRISEPPKLGRWRRNALYVAGSLWIFELVAALLVGPPTDSP